ncbi:MAG TPA: arginine decarboxylase [Flavobacteriaceae bacterium]|jgi:hypothetical protein|nr:DUF4266 domain-containing protein [Bacteroidota bacterium]MDB4028263.1 DUF4266 domain-containing protein [Flavobacteriaceae bacterium]MDB4216003.1 DUF4266 domain-containing protein [bacterium]MDG1270710.1 DUF4266 domain-containing protein [Ulvibacter sp.]MBT5871290.1 DUF4266 domain-containing protein [Bacteroidota bacterium]|tara:strand:- start:99 stop:308 length:210 start_codon:yes stop_codon:yes gene_type:complete
MKKLLILLIALGFLSSCAVVKEYEKVNINDPDMALGDKTIKRFETSAQAYREAASGANGGKTGGGCGCN